MTVSLCVVAYNEEKILPSLLADLQSQTYPHHLTEIVLVNSMSTDGTREIMESFAASNESFSSVIVVDNPKKFQACGWNVALKTATGDVIIRIDAHTSVPPEFVSLNMKNIEDGEYVSGGVRPCLIEGDSKWSQTLLQVENSLFGSSINKCRRTVGKTYVKTMFHAAYRREVFAKVGGFNENLMRTEDNELHYRIREAGYKLSFDSEIVSYQYARSDFKKMIKQKKGNGQWIGLTLGVCPGCVSPFYLIPFCFVCGIVFTTALALLGFWHLAALMWTLYGAFSIVNTVLSIISNGFIGWKLLMPFLFFVLHVSYGIGTLIGLLQMPFRRKTLKNCPEIENVKEVIKKKGTVDVDEQ